jgi:uncharacterized glyoxalase superfamily protein PhnB
MNAHTTVAGRTLVPTLRYRDVPTAMTWLCQAFGFEKHLVVAAEDGAIRYAQLTFGEGMIMVVPVEDTAFDQLMKQPEEAGGAETQICYLYVEDVGSHYARAKAGGAEILLDLDQGDDSGRGYSCRDLEGHIWNFGTYDPWRRQEAPVADAGQHRSAYRRPKQLGVMVALFATIALGAAIGFGYGPVYQGLIETASEESSETEALVQRERRAREAAERVAAAARDQLARERSAREQAERASKEAEARAVAARTNVDPQTGTPPRALVEAAERASQEAVENMKQAQREAEAARELLSMEQKAREAAEEAVRQAREQVARDRDRSIREAAQRMSKDMREQSQRERYRRVRVQQAAEGPNGPSWIHNW